jgi:hypothetical protein
VLERERMLDVAQGWNSWQSWKDFREAILRLGGASTKGFQPTLRILAEALERASGGGSGHDHSPMMPEVR